MVGLGMPLSADQVIETKVMPMRMAIVSVHCVLLWQHAWNWVIYKEQRFLSHAVWMWEVQDQAVLRLIFIVNLIGFTVF